MYSFYSYKRKKPTGLIITIVICSIIVGITGYFIYKSVTTPLPFKNNKTEEALGEPVTKIESEAPVRYESHCVLNVTEKYLCGHNTVSSGAIPSSFVGKTIEEIKKTTDLDIISYTDFSINAEKLFDKECQNHYIIKLKGGKLTSYNKNIPDITVKETTINLPEYSKDDIEILKNGIEVGSKEEMLEFFEDFA